MPDYKLATQRAAVAAGINPRLFVNQIGAESNFNPNASSPAGAQGIAQFEPATAAQAGVNLHDGLVSDDLKGAAKLMAGYLKQYGGSWAKALTAYNAGPGRVGKPLLPETAAYIKRILGGADVTQSTGGHSGLPSKANASSMPSTHTVTTTSGGQDVAAALTDALLQHHSGGLLQTAIAGLDSGAYGKVAVTTKGPLGHISTSVPSQAAAANAPGAVATFVHRADVLNAAHEPYLWGGGHGGKVDVVKHPVPLDCSGTVSAILGINPLVSGQFAKWGQAGEGKHVTIYANATHVFMKINGHFYGTSASNPGGGAGWIPAGAFSPSYLKNFTVRHPVGL